MSKHVFIIGCKGIPANYGGFETFVEKLTEHQKDQNIQYHVAKLSNRFYRYEYNGAKCFEIKVPEIGAAKAIYYDLAALKYCIHYCRRHPKIQEPIIYILACRIGPFIGHYKKQIEALGGKLYVNPDGHEWLRGKWSAPVKRYWKLSEQYMVKHADLLICDSKNIEQYIKEEYGKYTPNTTFIAYGAEIAQQEAPGEREKYAAWCQKRGVKPQGYYLVVGRLVPENNIETIIREFMQTDSDKKLIVIATENPGLQERLKEKLHYQDDARIIFAGTVYDQQLLKQIREHAFAYIHGHEVGGTNPSLLEALGYTRLDLLLKVGFNQEVAEDGALYWTKEKGSLAELMTAAEQMPEEELNRLGAAAHARIQNEYSWDKIVTAYESLFLNGKDQ